MASKRIFADRSLFLPFLQSQRPGLITDFDGTLSPIVPRHNAAAISRANYTALQQVSQHMTLTAVVSGRAAADVQQRVNLPNITYIGNHGLETWRDGKAHLNPQVAGFRPRLAAAANALRSVESVGVKIEDKGATIALHYRQAPDPDAAARTLQPRARQTAQSFGLELHAGRMVFELRPPLKINKGTALAQLIAEHQLDAAIFIGDDITDASAMYALREMRIAGPCHGVAVAVRTAESPLEVLQAADVCVDEVAGVAELLLWLAQSRTASLT